MNRVKEYWNALNENITVNRRELVLGLAACTLAGLVVGLLLAPPKSLSIGNGNRIIADNHQDEEDAEAVEDAEAAEEEAGE